MDETSPARHLMSDGSWCDCAPLCFKLRLGPHGCHATKRSGERRQSQIDIETRRASDADERRSGHMRGRREGESA
jgi:hypothetical protein